jgi:pimeloyl-ACP methyl ester carboxylesterase
MTLPGFGAGDASMAVIRQRLRRQGFRPYKWELGINRGNVPSLLGKATERVLELAERSGQPLGLVGWSLGGYIAREIARNIPDAVKHVVTLGSPIIGGPKYTTVAPYYQSRGVDLDQIEAVVAARASAPLSVPVTCVFSRRDGVVDWRAAIDRNNPLTTNIEVDCSHLAMGFDPAVLDLIPAALAD